MAVHLNGVTTVLLPGTGSDDDFVYRAFSAALHEVGAVVVTPPPQPGRLIDGYREALDNAAEKTKDGVKKAADSTGDALKTAGDKVKDATK